jgi:tetratricopeptide (TPR) repeat protein
LLLMRVQGGRSDFALMAWIGYCLAQTTNYYSARSYFVDALKHSDHADLRNNLGYCYGKLGKVADAEKQFTHALKLDSLLQAAFHNRASLLLHDATSRSINLPDTCWKDFKSAADLGPKNGELSVDSAKAIAYAHYKKQPIDGNLREQIVLALVAGIERGVFRTSRFAHERLNLDELANRAKGFQGPPIPRSVPLLLPPRVPLPER